MLIVDTNYGAHGVMSRQMYTHFSLLKSLEAGFGLPASIMPAMRALA
jgi:hypothetical protein